MCKWRSETALLSRYVGGGAFNTIVGFAVIFCLSRFGISPLIANIGGYFIGFILGFFLSKKLVFRSTGKTIGEGWRYLIVFFVSFLINIAVLQICIVLLMCDENYSQILAAITYSASMYGLTRCFVFKNPVRLPVNGNQY